MKQGFDAELDELLDLSQNSSRFLIEYETKERERTGIATLKVGFNRVHGFYIELSRAQSEQAPTEYIRRQTLKNVERYITPELKTHEDKVLSSKSRALAREKHLYEALIDELQQQLEALSHAAQALSELDVLCNLTERADTLNLVRPQFTHTPSVQITQGRHLVVEHVTDTPFIANSTILGDAHRMQIITGPNMGGKSTYMRQTALITLLSFMGSFVPAMSATMGPIDRIFTRIGAADDLAGGRSTFMVEMTETANILNNATANSLVLLDEIGRGTSTFDGLSLAFAIAEHLANQSKSLTLFATHYFELTALAEHYPAICNVHLTASEHGDDIVFLHQVKTGPANQSYGLQVAKLAGIPKGIIQQAAAKLRRLEQDNQHTSVQQQNLPLTPEPVLHPVVIELSQLDINQLTPMQALSHLQQMKEQID